MIEKGKWSLSQAFDSSRERMKEPGFDKSYNLILFITCFTIKAPKYILPFAQYTMVNYK